MGVMGDAIQDNQEGEEVGDKEQGDWEDSRIFRHEEEGDSVDKGAVYRGEEEIGK